jgi:transketolase
MSEAFDPDALETIARELRVQILRIADTIKGKGVPSMENKPEWHGLPPTPQQAERFVAELLGEVGQ